MTILEKYQLFFPEDFIDLCKECVRQSKIITQSLIKPMKDMCKQESTTLIDFIEELEEYYDDIDEKVAHETLKEVIDDVTEYPYKVIFEMESFIDALEEEDVDTFNELSSDFKFLYDTLYGDVFDSEFGEGFKDLFADISKHYVMICDDSLDYIYSLAVNEYSKKIKTL